MFVNWDEVQRALIPIKDYEDLSRRLRGSFSYPFVRETFNVTMPELVAYTRLSVGGDPRGRYAEYTERLVGILTMLQQTGLSNLLELVSQVETREKLRSFAERNGIAAHDIATVLKYLIYWFIPGEKYLSGLIRPDPNAQCGDQCLGRFGGAYQPAAAAAGDHPRRSQRIGEFQRAARNRYHRAGEPG